MQLEVRCLHRVNSYDLILSAYRDTRIVPCLSDAALFEFLSIPN